MSYRPRKYKPPVFTLAAAFVVVLILLISSLRDRPEKQPELPAESAVPVMETDAPTAEPISSDAPSELPEASETTPPDDRPVFSSYPDLGRPTLLNRSEALSRLSSYAAEDWRLSSILEHEKDYSDEILQSLGNNLELTEFFFNYPTADNRASGGFTQAELLSDHPLLLQWDSRWGYVQYGSGPIGITGCGPTCLSMAALALTGDKTATPNAIAAYSLRCGFYTKGAGSTWTLISEGCTGFGMTARELPLWEDKMKEALDNDEVIICCVGAGDFTLAGHFILIYGYTEDGFQVNDPNSRVRSEKVWTYSTLESQISNLWALSPAE